MAEPTPSVPKPEDEDPAKELLLACSDGNLPRLKTLLAEPSLVKVALAHQERPYNSVRLSIPNLRMMLANAARAGNAQIVELLLAFAHEHDVAYDTLIVRDVILPAIDSSNVEVFKNFVRVMPESVNSELSLLGDPLSYAVGNDKESLVFFLLDHGANPNKPCAAHRGPGHHLRSSVQSSSLQVTNALLQHGAQVAQSGALQMAARQGRVDVLQTLLNHEADVNERLEPTVGFLSHKNKRQEASETPLHVATAHRQSEAVAWLLDHGANPENKDLQGQTPLMVAAEKGDQAVLDIFRARNLM